MTFSSKPSMATMRNVVILGSVAATAALVIYHQNQLHKRRKDYKPQRNFKIVLADNSPQPFSHLKRDNSTGTSDSHPFYEEIKMLLEMLGNMERPTIDSTPPPMKDDYIWISSKEQLVELAEMLSMEREFAVDTEQHSIRSFLGFTSLIQISTRTHDYLIDAIALHDDMSILREVFSNPSICKVFHGADSDSLWLQRDFHIYIVNLFDTARACDVLGKPQRSLAYLLQTYCGIETNKMFQRADWRLRPLPEEMIIYARTDAHYLLYIADCLRNELLQGCNTEVPRTGTLYEECVRRSNTLCLQLYDKDAASPATVAASLLSRSKSYLSSIDENTKDGERCRRVVHALCEWRDSLARTEDESSRYVLSDQAILALAKKGSVKMKSILDSLSKVDDPNPTPEAVQYMTPFPSPSPVLLRNIDSLVALLKDIEKQIEKDSESLKRCETDASKEIKDIVFQFWNLFTTFKKDSFPKELPEKQLQHKSTKINKRAEKRMQRRWKSGDLEASRDRFVKKFSCKAPVYHNCRIYAGDDRLLCFCDRKKLDWYVLRGLAEYLDEDPPAIKLLFEPKGRPEDENNDFYIQSKTNRCVGCGETNHYLRYRVIPSCYRQHFPEHLKSHRSHDIVLLCVDCHEVAHCAAEKHKRQVAQDFGVPLFCRRVVDSGTLGGEGFEAQVIDSTKGGVSPLQLRTAAMALLRHGSMMPEGRRQQLEATVRAYYGGREISQEDIEAALIVGKGPRELRRLRRKKGLQIEKLLKGAINNTSIPGSEPTDTHHTETNSIENGNKYVEKSIPAGVEASYSNLDNTEDISAVDESVASITLEDTEEADSADFNHEEPDPIDPLSGKLQGSDPHEGTILDENIRKDANSFHNIRNSGNSRKAAQRISLLGHGPHGKKVVEMILQKEGESGIARFCQRWRAVFVTSVKPAYLPQGWDILHSR